MNPVRCSQLPIIDKCPAAAHIPEGEIIVDADSEISRLGSAVHAAIAVIVQGAQPNLSAIATRFGLKDTRELSILTAAARNWWFETGMLTDSEGNPLPALVEIMTNLWVEEAVISADGIITGHPDLYGSLDNDTGIIIDWKSGYKTDADCLAQLKGYGSIVSDYNPMLSQIVLVVIYLRDSTYQSWSVSADELRSWRDDLIEKVRAWDGKTYKPGEHCLYCPRFESCEGRSRRAVAAVKDLTGITITPELLAARGIEIYSELGELERLVKAGKNYIRDHVQRTGRIADDEYELVFSDPPDEINASTAAPVLLKQFSPIEIISALEKLPKGKLADLAASKVSKGKGIARKELIETLRAAGATMPGTPRLKLQKIQNTKEIKA